MSQFCPRCGLPPYGDQSMVVVQLNHIDVSASQPSVTWCCCPDCAADLQGLPKPPRRKYGSGNWQFLVCGVCRHALRLGAEPILLRLAPSDIAGTEIEKPGLYASCKDCVERFAPFVFERLKDAGLLQHPSQMTANWLG